ncbi:MAG: hypothetical protein HC897_20100 [Thermoanaerobaculia bacterium]|nr:hypothetical protein [Thermoanaerobaculia bacterium]
MTLPYEEGHWFAVPLPTSGFAVGLVARASKRGQVLLGYFFGGRFHALPLVEDLESLTLDSALLVARFGDLALLNFEWPILGKTQTWRRNQWPMPPFVSRDPLTDKVWQIEYADDDPNRLIKRMDITDREYKDHPLDGVYGARAITRLLDHVLSKLEKVAD